MKELNDIKIEDAVITNCGYFCGLMEESPGADVLYLHGFGSADPTGCAVFRALSKALNGKKARLHAPTYHPNGQVYDTRIETFLHHLEALAQELPTKRFTLVVGYSVGGLLGALFQERHPELVGRAVLLAPAVDNFARNFQQVPQECWYMPPAYVEELQKLPARPSIRVPTWLVHGAEDDDSGGSCPWRVQEWAASEHFEKCFFPEGVDHSLQPWLDSMVQRLDGLPILRDVLAWGLDEMAPTIKVDKGEQEAASVL